MAAVASEGGFQFEIKMAALIGIRGLRNDEDFELSSNIENAGNFDDLVYTAGGRRYFLQLKHTMDPDKKKLTKQELVTLLQKCFKSYRKIKNGNAFRDISVDETEFIIYTNRDLGPEFSEHELKETKNDIFFMTCEKSVSNVNPDTTKETDVYKLFERSVMARETSEVSEDMDQKSLMSEFLNKLIIVTGQKGNQELDYLIAEEIREQDVIQVGPKDYMSILHHFKTPLEAWWRSTKTENVTRETVTKWLQRAKTDHYTPVVTSLTMLLKRESTSSNSEKFKTELTSKRAVHLKCRDTKEKMTATTSRNWLQEENTASCTPVIRNFFNSCTKKLARTGIEFSDREISRLQAELSNTRAVHVRSDALSLCSILLLDCLPQSKRIFVTFESLQSNKNMLLHAWLGGHWEWLIVSCDSTVQQSDITDTCLEMSEIIKHDPSSKCVIILTEYSVQQVTGFVPIDHRFKFEQLSKKSQAMVLDKKIDFQGCEVTMRSVLQRHGNVEHVLGPELVTDLITEETAVNIGGKLHVNTGYYAPRFLKRKIYLKLDVLRNPEFDNEVFAVSGMTKEKLLEIVSSDETVENFNVGETRGVRFIVLPREDIEICFSELCKNNRGETLHWLKYKGGELLWNETRGDIVNLLDYIDTEKTRADKRIIKKYMKRGSCEVKEDLIWKMCERTVLVVAEPGMGKSSTTTHVAWHTKERDSTSWVVRINWNDHTRKLQEIDAATFNLDTLVEFLCSAAFPHSKYTDINRSLLKQALKSSGNVTVLMDGFDEISPTYADKAAAILFELMKTEVGKVWVTSRPVEKERLETELSVIAFNMKNLSHKSQEDMLSNLWKNKAGEEEIRNDRLLEFITHLLFNLKYLLRDVNFTGCPLYITMIATVYEMEVETCLNSEHWIKPRFDLVNLYEKFVERKLHIYLTEKQMADITKPSVLDSHEVTKQRLLMNFEKCALAVILPSRTLKSLHNKKIEDEIKPILERVDKGKDKTGVVMNVVEGKPQFVHRTFAEYFTARWFSKNFQSNRSVLEHIFFDRKYSFVTNMFDRMLARGCPLHCAVLEGDVIRFETLVNEGCDVNAVDKGARNIMHIIAKREKEFVHYERYIERFIDIFHDYRVPFDATDCVLQWTPLQYATKSEKWLFVKFLLQRNVDRSGLDMIRQRAHVPDYIGPIIIEAATYGHMLLLEFIRSIGVNIHQAYSMYFPSPLHAATWIRQLPLVRWLIKHCADCNTRYSNGQTALFHYIAAFMLCVVTLSSLYIVLHFYT